MTELRALKIALAEKEAEAARKEAETSRKEAEVIKLKIEQLKAKEIIQEPITVTQSHESVAPETLIGGYVCTSKHPVWNSTYNPTLCGVRGAPNMYDNLNYYGQCPCKAVSTGGYCRKHINTYKKKGWWTHGDVRCFGVGAFPGINIEAQGRARWLERTAHKMTKDSISEVAVELTDGRPAEIIAKYPMERK